MKLIPLLALALAMSGCATPTNAVEPTGPNAPAGGGVAVVELYTSEGCSSCPPADDVLAEWVAKARDENLPVYALAFHVDYWDNIGWPDRFASPEATARQRAHPANGRQVYTPQMIVNGSAAFVGSNRAEADRQIAAALDRRQAVPVSIVAKSVGDGMRVTYNVADAPAGAILTVAVVERGLVTKVARGENRGRELRHENVVRAFRSSPLANDRGDVTLALPADVRTEKASVIAYVQSRHTLQVLGATAVATIE